MDKTSLGDRMKNYENVSRYYLPNRSPVIIRIDGRAFHTFTQGMQKPYDTLFAAIMQNVTRQLCKEIGNTKFAYQQSDEISLLLIDYENIETQPWFSNNLNKLVSVSSSIATYHFNELMHNAHDLGFLTCTKGKPAYFDARAFVLPKDEVNNYFVWRQQDCTRNSIESAGHAYFSHKELQGKKCNEVQEMLFSRKSINWNDYPVYFKRGFCVKRVHDWPHDIWQEDYNIPIFSQNPFYINELVGV